MTTTVKIAGMKCGGCANAVKMALETIPGVTSLDVKVGEAVLGGDVDITQVKNAIKAKGFEVVSIS